MKNQMKKLIFVNLIFLFSCSEKKSENTTGGEPHNQAVTSNVHTLIFIDKTKSVNVNKPFVAQKYEQAINALVEQNVRRAGDKLEVYFIHENTAKSRCLSLTSRTEKDNTQGMNATDQEAAQTNYDLSIRKERNFFLQQTIAKLKTENTDASSKETDVWASLPVIAKAAENQGTVKVYYFSDMVESMNDANRRDFQVKPPKNDVEAESWAKIDAERLKKNVLGSPEITMILPFEPTSSTKENNPTITHYWQKLFENLGVMTVTEL
jgi:hypothetical protein